MNTKQQFNALEKVVSVFEKFNGKQLTKVRKELHETVKKLEAGQIAGWRFVRQDNKETKRIQLWAYRNCFEHNMHPDFEIGVSTNGEVWVQNDILWKTLYGLQEQMQEEAAYEDKANRWGS